MILINRRRDESMLALHDHSAITHTSYDMADGFVSLSSNIDQSRGKNSLFVEFSSCLSSRHEM